MRKHFCTHLDIHKEIFKRTDIVTEGDIGL